ncbi:MAG: TIGR02677 family protein [Bacilli bacterium]
MSNNIGKQVLETKYLAVENTFRYRPIIRYFFLQYEKLEYWIFKEEVYENLKDSIIDYTLFLCEQDLERLVEWNTLTKIQDTSNVSNIEEFKNRKFRYQLTEYAVEIERLMIRLENLHIESSSLEPKLFEKIKINLEQLLILKDNYQIYDAWQSLIENFKNLNENYQDFLKKFHETVGEELMKTTQFLLFKDDMVRYLRDFIKNFQTYNHLIFNILTKYDEEKINNIMNSIIDYQKTIPKIEPDFNYNYLKEVNLGKWNNLYKWFVETDNKPSESSNLINATNDIISKITKYVSSIIEIYGQSANRTNEYKHICKLFGKLDTDEEARKLALSIFGISEYKHFIGLEKETDDINISPYDLIYEPYNLKSRSNKIRNKIEKTPIIDKTFEKEKQLKEYLETIQKEKEILKKYINKKQIIISELEQITTFERRFILDLITKGTKNLGKIENYKEYDIKFKVSIKNEEKIILKSDEGLLEMPNFIISFIGE